MFLPEKVPFLAGVSEFLNRHTRSSHLETVVLDALLPPSPSLSSLRLSSPQRQRLLSYVTTAPLPSHLHCYSIPQQERTGSNTFCSASFDTINVLVLANTKFQLTHTISTASSARTVSTLISTLTLHAAPPHCLGLGKWTSSPTRAAQN